MLNKSKQNLSVILLVVGLGLIPTGLFIKGYLSDEVSSNVSSVLTTIEEEAVSEIEELYLGLGIPEVLPELFESLIPDTLTDVVYPISIPKTLTYIKDKTMEKLPGFINASKAAQWISGGLEAVNSSSSSYDENMFFNDINFHINFSYGIWGISEFMTTGATNLSYSSTTTHRLLYGHRYDITNYPGILQDLELGTGLLNWLNFYNNAEANIGTNRSLIQTVYGCSWSSNQLQNLSAYIKYYLFNQVKLYLFLEGTNLEDYANLVFYQQWANASLKYLGISLDQISEQFSDPVYGLEVGRNASTGISLETSIELWNPSNSSSFLDNNGIEQWLYASSGNSTIEDYLKSIFMLTQTQIESIYEWLTIDLETVLVPLIISLPVPNGYGMTPSEYAGVVLLRQWANATYLTEGINLGYGLKGFEAGIPKKINITLTTSMILFDESNTSSFVNRDGILNWIDAYEGDTNSQNDILSTFNINLKQLDLVTEWLFITLRFEVIPAVTGNITRRTMNYYAQNEFYRQWSDGKLFKNGLELVNISGLDSVSGWELGIPIASNIDEGISNNLWDEAVDYSLVNFKGISLWFKALKESSTKIFLQNFFNLDSSEVDVIIEWLVQIREGFTLEISQIEANLPVDHPTLANNMFLGLLITGGVLLGLGAIGVIMLLIAKRK